MSDINVNGFNWNIEANQSISEDDFVKCHIDSEGVYPTLEPKAKEKALREAHKLMNPKKKAVEVKE